MSQVQAATDITAVIKQVIADHTSYPLVVEEQNRNEVDQVTQTNPYLKVEVKFFSADQMDMADHPRVEQWGQIFLTAMCKPGQGTVGVKTLIDFVRPYFELKQIGIVHCRAVSAVDGKEVKGVWREPAIVNFYYHRIT